MSIIEKKQGLRIEPGGAPIISVNGEEETEQEIEM